MTDEPDDPLAAALRRAWQADEEPADDGFTRRVMASLPARPVAATAPGPAWGQGLHWVAISVAAGAAAGLIDPSQGPLDSPRQLAGYTLLAWMVFWSIPSRWSRL